MTGTLKSLDARKYVYCMFVICAHAVAVLNDAFCMTYSLLMSVEDTKGDYMEEAYYRAGLMIAL